MDRGIVWVEDARMFVAMPADAVGRFIEAAAENAAVAQAQLRDIAAAVPFITGSNVRPAAGAVHGVTPLDGEVSSGGDPVPLLATLIRQSRGDLLWLRPDQFRRPGEDKMADIIGDVARRGRRSRAIYPVRALTEARETLQRRAAVGEQIRMLPDVPTRMLVIGSTHAVLPEPLGFVDEPRTLTRQAGLVQALTLWFELMWERAVPFADDDDGDALRPDLRRFLLEQLATGAQDEQIARRLGVSLRTVRRRVAELMTELGSESRFQLGVEAVRRGWL